MSKTIVPKSDQLNAEDFISGSLTYTIQGDTGLTVSIEGSDSANTGWGEVASGILTAGSFQFTIDPKLAPKRFLRARVL